MYKMYMIYVIPRYRWAAFALDSTDNKRSKSVLEPFIVLVANKS